MKTLQQVLIHLLEKQANDLKTSDEKRKELLVKILTLKDKERASASNKGE